MRVLASRDGLGVRHAVRAQTTLPIFANHQPIPFDTSFVRALPYDLGDHNEVTDASLSELRKSLSNRLRELREQRNQDGRCPV